MTEPTAESVAREIARRYLLGWHDEETEGLFGPMVDDLTEVLVSSFRQREAAELERCARIAELECAVEAPTFAEAAVGARIGRLIRSRSRATP